MEVVLPSSPTMDFDFGSARSSPSINYLSAPSSPRRFGQCFLSAPASPTRITELYRQFDDFSMAMERSQSRAAGRSVSAIPFDWEEKPGTPKAATGASPPGDEIEFDFHFDFAFDVNAEADKGARSAEELFSGGKILPLKPPPRLQVVELDEAVSARSPLIPAARSPRSSPIAQGKKMLRDFFLPRRKKQSEAFRISEFSWEEERKLQLQQKQEQEQSMKQSSDQKASLTSSSSSKVSSSSSKRWSFKDFLLFRSASEGRGSDKDPLRKYAPRPQVKKLEQVKNSSFRSTSSDIRNSSFRSTESSASGTGSRRRISAHEMHYAVNKAASDDLKKKTFLPYKQGILGPGFGGSR